MIFVVNPSFLFARSSKRLAPLLPSNLDDTTVMERHLLLTQTTFNDFPKPTNPCRLATPVLSDVHNKCTSSRLRNLGRRGLHPKLLTSCTEALCGLNLRHCRIPESERLKCCPVETGLYIRQLLRFLHPGGKYGSVSTHVPRAFIPSGKIPAMKLTAGKKSTVSTLKSTLDLWPT